METVGDPGGSSDEHRPFPPRLFGVERSLRCIGTPAATKAGCGPNTIAYKPSPAILDMVDRLAGRCGDSREDVVGAIVLDWLYDHCGPGPDGYDPAASAHEKHDWFWRMMFRGSPGKGGPRASGMRRPDGRKKRGISSAAGRPRVQRR